MTLSLTSNLAIFLSGVFLDGAIPVWSVVLSGVGVVGAFFTLRQKMSSHEKEDDIRFNAQDKMLEEIRGDVKELLKHATPSK